VLYKLVEKGTHLGRTPVPGRGFWPKIQWQSPSCSSRRAGSGGGATIASISLSSNPIFLFLLLLPLTTSNTAVFISSRTTTKTKAAVVRTGTGTGTATTTSKYVCVRQMDALQLGVGVLVDNGRVEPLVFAHIVPAVRDASELPLADLFVPLGVPFDEVELIAENEVFDGQL